MPEPTITSKNLPPGQHPAAKGPTPPTPQASVEVVLPYDQIEAKPLRSPNFISLKHRNPNMSLFWGNRAVGEKESGLRYDQLIAMGFIAAKPEEVITMTGDSVPPSICRDGRVMYGDLILLKIPRTDYLGAQKWNEQNARRRVKRPGVSLEGGGASKDIGGREVLQGDGRRDMQPAGFPKSPKVVPYVPNLAEVDSRTADNSGPEINLADPPKT